MEQDHELVQTVDPTVSITWTVSLMKEVVFSNSKASLDIFSIFPLILDPLSHTDLTPASIRLATLQSKWAKDDSSIEQERLQIGG